MIKPEFVTFTGLDAATDLDRVEDLAHQYPIEWGVLFSPNRQGKENRYPSFDTISDIVKRKNLRLAAHICGAYARAIMENEIPDEVAEIVSYFQRFQINTADDRAGSPDHPLLFRTLVHDGEGDEKSLIFQSRDPVGFPAAADVSWLYDRSGGNGEVPVSWPPHPGRLVGYAGGINSDNATEIMFKVGTAGPYWLDMESGIRTDDLLDLDKCEAVCKAIWAL